MVYVIWTMACNSIFLSQSLNNDIVFIRPCLYLEMAGLFSISHQFHNSLTSTSPRFPILISKEEKEEMRMFLGIEWYWWVLIAAAFIVSVPFKMKFMKWCSRRRQEKKEDLGKRGDDKW